VARRCEPVPAQLTSAVPGGLASPLCHFHLLGPGYFLPTCACYSLPSYVDDGARVSTVSTVLVWIALAAIVCCLLATGFMCFLSSTPTPLWSVLEADPDLTHFPSLGRHGEQRLRGQHPGADHGHEPERLLPPSVRRLPFPIHTTATHAHDHGHRLIGSAGWRVTRALGPFVVGMVFSAGVAIKFPFFGFWILGVLYFCCFLFLFWLSPLERFLVGDTSAALADLKSKAAEGEAENRPLLKTVTPGER